MEELEKGNVEAAEKDTQTDKSIESVDTKKTGEVDKTVTSETALKDDGKLGELEKREKKLEELEGRVNEKIKRYESLLEQAKVEGIALAGVKQETKEERVKREANQILKLMEMSIE